MTISSYPRVFISYSHDSDEHRDRVLALSQSLRTDGADTVLDRYVEGVPEKGWPRWMMDQIDEANYVLLVCTETYYRRFRGHESRGQGNGVDWEGVIITQQIYDARSVTSKFVPIVFQASDAAFIPEPVRQCTRYDCGGLWSPEPDRTSYRELCDFLSGRAGVKPAPIVPFARQSRDRRSNLPTAIPTSLDMDPEASLTPFDTKDMQAIHHWLLQARVRRAALKRVGENLASVDADIINHRRLWRQGSQLRTGDVLSDRFVLTEVIGGGGFGRVWRAKEMPQSGPVAIKVLHPDQANDPSKQERFFRGARIMSELEHPGIVAVVQPRAEHRGYLYFVMELVEGQNLHKAVTDKAVPKERVVPIVVSVGRALAYAHARGIIHRDIKPANIILATSGESKLTDFDLVQAGDTTGGTRTGAMGTFFFSAPEQMQDAATVDVRADVYSLGMTALFCLLGMLPVDVLQRPGDVIARLPVSGAIKKALTQAIAWRKEDRFLNITSFCDALEDAERAAALAPADGQRRASAILRAAVPRRRTLLIGAIAAVAGTVAWLQSSSHPEPSEEPEPSPSARTIPPPLPPRSDLSPPHAMIRHPFDVTTRAFDNNRSGWNNTEPTFRSNNLGSLHLIRTFPVDEKVEVPPLVVGDTLYIFTMNNTVYRFDVKTGELLNSRTLAPAIDPSAQPGEMDIWHVYRKWGIASTPVIDPDTNTLYVATLQQAPESKDNLNREHHLWTLDATTLADQQPDIVIEGDADNYPRQHFNSGIQTPYQKLRGGLGLLRDTAGNKAIVAVFSMNGEDPRGPGHGFAFAYDTRGLLHQAGFRPIPAIWCVTPNGGAGGIWMAGSSPVLVDANIYFTTGNGAAGDDNFSESVVKLEYLPGRAGVKGGRPQLKLRDYWTAFDDATRGFNDQDFGSGGVMRVPGLLSLLAGGKDGILYNLNLDILGRNTWKSQFNLPFVATYLPNAPNNAPGLPASTPPNPDWPIVKLDRNLRDNTPDRKTHGFFGPPVYLQTADQGYVYVWGANERVRVYNYDLATQRIESFRAQGTLFASLKSSSQEGLFGGLLAVSSNGAVPGSAVLWATIPRGDANSAVVQGMFAAFDATAVKKPHQLKLLFSHEYDFFSKFAPPVISNGRAYVATFGNSVLQFGL